MAIDKLIEEAVDAAGAQEQAGGPPGTPKAPRKPRCDPERSYDQVTALMQEIKAERKRPCFALVTSGIDDEIYDECYSWKRELKSAADAGGLDILIDSPGGSLTSCYMIARLFARSANAWEALVPRLAASGATAICLGSSMIVMAENARMSPLDPQVLSKRREKFFQIERQSPLEAFETVRYLRTYMLSSLHAAMLFLLDRGVTPPLALEYAAKVARNLVEPVLCKVEPYDLGSFALDSRVAIEYCKRISRPAVAALKTQRQVDPRTLVEEYPAHGFVIDFEEAKSLNFAVSKPPSAKLDELFEKLCPVLDGIDTYIGVVP